MNNENTHAENEEKTTDEIVTEEVETIYGNVQKVKRLRLTTYTDTIFPWQNKIWDIPAKQAVLQKMFADACVDEDADIVGLVYVTDDKPKIFSNDTLAGKIGCAVHVREFEKTADGTMLVQIRGLCRFIPTGDFKTENGYLTGEIEWFDDEEEINPSSRNREALLEEVRIANNNLSRMAKLCGEGMKQFQYIPESFNRVNGAHMLSFFFLSMLNYFNYEQRIEMTKIRSTLLRLKAVNFQMNLILNLLEKDQPIRQASQMN